MLTIHSASCGLHYHRIIEEHENPNNFDNRHSREEDSQGYQMMDITQSKKRKFEDLTVGVEEMSNFKRVRVNIMRVENEKPLANRVLDVRMTSSTYDTVLAAAGREGLPRTGPGSRGRNTIRKPRITNADRARLKAEKYERERMSAADITLASAANIGNAPLVFNQ